MAILGPQEHVRDSIEKTGEIETRLTGEDCYDRYRAAFRRRALGNCETASVCRETISMNRQMREQMAEQLGETSNVHYAAGLILRVIISAYDRMMGWVEKCLNFLPLFRELHRARDCYLSLIEACLAGTIYEDPPLTVLGLTEFVHLHREYGWDWPSKAHTMIGVKRLSNLRTLTERVIRNGVPGDLMETGVWRGGACILMAAVLKAYGVTDRRVWVADSFEGCPAPDAEQYPDDSGSVFHTYRELAVSLEEVKDNFEKYGLLDDHVVFLKGWFQDTLPTAAVERLALLRLDGDMYESTLVALKSLYHKVSPGGYIIVDDYHVVEQAKKAIHDFWAARGISPQLEEIDGVGVFWKKLPIEDIRVSSLQQQSVCPEGSDN